MKKWFFCVLPTLITTICAVSIHVSAQTPVASSSYSFGPVTDYQKALPNSRDVVKFRRGERYNSPNAVTLELGEDSDSTLVGVQMEQFGRDPMPFSTSDAVVVGSVDSGQAFMSNDKRDIYSEFVVSTQEVIKSPRAPYVGAGDKIEVERQGGVIRLSSGKLITRGDAEQSMPTVGRRYLFFLRYSADTNDYRIITGYELFQGRVYSLDGLDQTEKYRRDNSGRLLHQKEDNEAKFLQDVKAAKPSEKGGPQ